MPSKPSLVFFGNEKLATGIASPGGIVENMLRDAGYEIEAVVSGPGTLTPTYESKLAVLVAHGQILRQPVLDQFPLGIINIHPSLLPAYRGSTPIEQAMLGGASKTGVSLMKLVATMDAGPVYALSELLISGHESKAELANQLLRMGGELLIKVLPKIFGGELEPTAQDESKATLTKLIKKTDGAIDWTKPAAQIEREIRAYLGWPGSFTSLLGTDVIVTAAHLSDESGAPGKAYQTDNKDMAVHCAKDSLVIERIKPAGKREMTGREFLAGHKL